MHCEYSLDAPHLGASNGNGYAKCFHEEKKINTFWLKKSALSGVCLCWGFTAQSTQWGHVERGQFT